jgi:hypothetical protein
MASKNQREFNLLLPSLALSALVFLLVIFIMNIPNPTPQPSVDARQERYLSKSQSVSALENDLVLLESDGIAEEVTIINSIE